MQITVNGKAFKLSRKEVRAAKRLASEQMEICKSRIDEEENPSLYITYLIMLNILSGEALESLDPDVISNALEIKERYGKERA